MRALSQCAALRSVRYRGALIVAVPPPRDEAIVQHCFDTGCIVYNASVTDQPPVGQGAYGTVYAAEAGRVAKIFKATAHIDMIRREIMMAKVVHANIIRVFGCFEDNGPRGGYGILMERGGQELFDIIAQGPLDDGQLRNYVEQILRGVDYLHRECQVYHLDLKPENMLVDGDVLKICDFGLSHSEHWVSNGRRFGSLSEIREGVVGFFGSPFYIPHPLVATSQDFVWKRDQWAIGCVVFAMAYNGLLYNSFQTQAYTNLWQKVLGNGPDYFASLVGATPRIVEPLLQVLICRDPLPLDVLLNTGIPGL